MRLSIAVEVETVCSVIVGLLSFDDMFNEFGFDIFATEEVADAS